MRPLFGHLAGCPIHPSINTAMSTAATTNRNHRRSSQRRRRASSTSSPPSLCGMKVVLLGDSSVGKTSVALRFIQEEFHPFLESTVGASFWSKRITLPSITNNEEDRGEDVGERQILLSVWDTAGQERFQSLTPLYVRGAQAAILVFDQTKAYTFDSLTRWVEELKLSISLSDMVLIVVGNKTDLLASSSQLPESACSDLSSSKSTVAEECNGELPDPQPSEDTEPSNSLTNANIAMEEFHRKALDFCESLGATYIQTSAKDGTNIHRLFRTVAQQAAEKGLLVPEEDSEEDAINLSGRANDESTRGCCY